MFSGRRLGFSIRIFGRSDLATPSSLPLGAEAHWSRRLTYLRDVLLYLQDNDVRMYRLHGGLAPRVVDAETFRMGEHVQGSRRELSLLRQLVHQADVRLSFHPYSAVVLNALNEDQVLRSVAVLEAEVGMLDALELGPEAVVVLHVGGVYDNQAASRERFVRRFEDLPFHLKGRLVLENDDRRFDHVQVRAIHESCGIPLVFDNLHHLVLNPEQMPMREALSYSLKTWPPHTVPKIHFSSPRTELRPLESGSRAKMPTWTEHSDLVNPFEFISFMDAVAGLGPFDIMLEAKARDLALLKLRQDLRRFAPALADSLV